MRLAGAVRGPQDSVPSQRFLRVPDLADLCLIPLSELFPGHSVITVDREDFHVYRRNKRETIPLICPP